MRPDDESRNDESLAVARLSSGDGSDGTRTRDLRRDRAAVSARNRLQTGQMIARGLTSASPFSEAAGRRSRLLEPQR